ncbi:MAG: phosphoribosylamine--glycine ligase [Gemmatimonadota bacterium]|nr:MAG: phosphoribosylamine--glycine ligase [Gemmatimonadota bacterium]
MKVLVVGGGGREHTLVWKINQSPLVDAIYCAPGNGGIARLAECVPIKDDDIGSLVDFAKSEAIGLTVVGPELPLTLGIVDAFHKEGLKIFGPSKEAAQIEGSKVFCKNILFKYGIPTGAAEIFDDRDEAVAYVKGQETPIVVKADGLAAGKGVILADSQEEALAAVDLIMIERAFGDAGERILIEECLTGQEASILALTDGETIVPLVPSQDHKRAYDHDAGPNTGGMGAYAPVPAMNERLLRQIYDDILEPTIMGLAEEDITYRGVLYAGLMLTPEGPKVLEFNCRFGDPETQVVLPLYKGDVVEAMLAVEEGRLGTVGVGTDRGAAVCVVLASGGYPGSYRKGKEIRGLEALDGLDDVVAFHAGTTMSDGKLCTAGGRVLGVTAFANDIQRAIDRVYEAVDIVTFDGMHYRKDIGRRALG